MPDRLRDAFDAALRGVLPNLQAYLRWEYTVVSVEPGPPVLISGIPAGASPFGPLAGIKLWPGPSGGYAVPVPGSLVLVEFHEGDVSKPAVVGLDPDNFPTQISLGGPLPLALTPAPYSAAVTAALKTFATGLNSGTLVAQASALVTALGPLPAGTLPPGQTEVTKAQ